MDFAFVTLTKYELASGLETRECIIGFFLERSPTQIPCGKYQESGKSSPLRLVYRHQNCRFWLLESQERIIRKTVVMQCYK